MSFAEREGHTRVPRGYRNADGFKLGAWVAAQQHSRKRERLTEDRVRRLERPARMDLEHERHRA